MSGFKSQLTTYNLYNAAKVTRSFERALLHLLGCHGTNCVSVHESVLWTETCYMGVGCHYEQDSPRGTQITLVVKEMANLHSHLDWHCQWLWQGLNASTVGQFQPLKTQLVQQVGIYTEICLEIPAGLSAIVLQNQVGESFYHFCGWICFKPPDGAKIVRPNPTCDDPTRLTCRLLVNHWGFSGWNPAGPKTGKTWLNFKESFGFQWTFEVPSKAMRTSMRVLPVQRTTEAGHLSTFSSSRRSCLVKIGSVRRG